MKRELSILIPVYNYICTPLVQGLCRQLEQLDIRCEIVVAEDGSSDESTLKANKDIGNMPYCRYLPRKENVGRASIRNLLAKESRYQWLLFLDCDMELPGDRFIDTYLHCPAEEVVDGGFAVKENAALMHRNLRYTYEWSEQANHSAARRAASPYRSFRTTNFLIRRDLMLAHPFDERFCNYGYEDVLFGKHLKQAGIGIAHIDNCMVLTDVEPNSVFVSKTEESLRTLYQFRDELRGYSHLLTVVNGIHVPPVRWVIYLWHKLFGCIERSLLCGSHPSLHIFRLYKLGYFLTLKN